MWEAAANVVFKEAPEGGRADILIGAQTEPDGWAFADVFYEAASPEAVKPITQALVCLNPGKRWKVGFDGDLKTYDLRYTLAHEIGHAIGLDHPAGGKPDHGLPLRGALPRPPARRHPRCRAALRLAARLLVAADQQRPDTASPLPGTTGGRALGE